MSHPYSQYEDTQLWKLLDRALGELERQHALSLTTARAHVLGHLCQELSPLQYWGSIHIALVWYWLREHSWPPHLSDEERLELARDVVKIGTIGTVDHVALFLRDMLPAADPVPEVASEVTRDIATRLMAVLTESRNVNGDGGF